MNYSRPNKGTMIRYNDEQGRLHKEDGPALITPNGRIYWYLHGVNYEPNSLLFKLKLEKLKRQKIKGD